MIERGAELWRWLEDGAHLYVCGDAERMAPDVHRALIEIVERHGGRSRGRRHATTCSSFSGSGATSGTCTDGHAGPPCGFVASD